MIIPRPCKGTEKTVEHENDDDTNCNWWSWYNHKWIGAVRGKLGNKGMSRDQRNYSIVKIGLYTE